MDNIKLSLLSKDNIWLCYRWYSSKLCDCRLDVIKKYGSSINITDLVRVTYDNSSSDFRNRNGYYYTKSDDLFFRIITVDDYGQKSECDGLNNDCAIRPVLISKEVYSALSNDADEVIYGEYPQYAPKKDMQEELEIMYNKKNLIETGKIYTFNDNETYHAETFVPVSYSEYIYKNKKYIRFRVINSIGDTLSNGIFYELGDYVWIEVMPVHWYIDKKEEILVAKEGLLSGVPYVGKKIAYDGKFNKTELYKYINTYMVKDLIPSVVNKDEISDLIEEIKECTKYFESNLEIKEKVKRLVDDYNNSLDNLVNKKNNNILDLTLDTEDTLYRNLKMELERILYELRKNSKDIKVYYDMIDILNNYESNKDDEIAILIYQINNIIEKNIIDEKNRNTLLNEFNEIISSYSKECKDRILELNNCNKTIDELKLEFRNKIHPFLIKLNLYIKNQDIIGEMSRNIKLILDNYDVDTKNKSIKYLLDLLHDIIVRIKEDSTESDLSRIKDILDFNIDYNANTLDIIRKLNDIIIKAYKLEFEIEERKNYVKKINSNRISIDI